eukprot:1488770-Pyramimonas_sp.AAC.1
MAQDGPRGRNTAQQASKSCSRKARRGKNHRLSSGFERFWYLPLFGFPTAQDGPGGLRDRPKVAKRPPRWPHDGPRGPPDGPKRAPRPPKRPPRRPR